jgi:hypothetical protein
MAIGQMKKLPVTIDEFMDSPEFLGCSSAEPLMDMWPRLKPVIRSMNPDVLAGEAPIVTALMGGATGWGKSHASSRRCSIRCTCCPASAIPMPVQAQPRDDPDNLHVHDG